MTSVLDLRIGSLTKQLDRLINEEGIVGRDGHLTIKAEAIFSRLQEHLGTKYPQNATCLKLLGAEAKKLIAHHIN